MSTSEGQRMLDFLEMKSDARLGWFGHVQRRDGEYIKVGTARQEAEKKTREEIYSMDVVKGGHELSWYERRGQR